MSGKYVDIGSGWWGFCRAKLILPGNLKFSSILFLRLFRFQGYVQALPFHAKDPTVRAIEVDIFRVNNRR